MSASVFRVSNPHRYGQKPVHQGGDGPDPLLFQTLIGTVKSRMEGPAFSAPQVFQTLIGTVKSRPGAHAPGQEIAFQTLIGTVKRCIFRA